MQPFRQTAIPGAGVDRAVRTPFRTTAPHSGAWFRPPACDPSWETQWQSRAPGFSLDQAWLLQEFGESVSGGKPSGVSLPAFLINQNNKSRRYPFCHSPRSHIFASSSIRAPACHDGTSPLHSSSNGPCCRFSTQPLSPGRSPRPHRPHHSSRCSSCRSHHLSHLFQKFKIDKLTASFKNILTSPTAHTHC